MVKGLFLAFLFLSQVLSGEEEKAIIVLITSYNNKHWAHENVISALHQDYTRYQVIYVDDASTDGTGDRVESLVKEDGREIHFTLVRNKERRGALANIYSSIHNLCEDDAIIVSLDGDDWFYDNQVLKKINAAYREKEIWITHGTFIEYPSESTNWSVPIPLHIVESNQFRAYRCPSHLRTFYAWLFKKVQLEDLLYDGQFFSMTWDQAMMFPMMEMAAERHSFIPSVLYVYNMVNPINDNKVHPQLQRDLETFIRAKPPYQRFVLPLKPSVNPLDFYKDFLEKGTYEGQDGFLLTQLPKSRYDTFKFVFEHLHEMGGGVVVELGTTRSFCHGGLPGCNLDDISYWEPAKPENWDWGAGFFTRMAAISLLDLAPRLQIHTVDIVPSHIERCKLMTQDFSSMISYHVESSVDFLKETDFPTKIDLLYLDTGDMTPIEPTALLQLEEAKIIVEKDLISEKGLILIDDVKNLTPRKFGDESNLGKSKYSIPFLLDHGFEIVMDEYQVVLQKCK